MIYDTVAFIYQLRSLMCIYQYNYSNGVMVIIITINTLLSLTLHSSTLSQ